MESAAHPFDAIRMRGLILPNRIAVSPMCMYTSDGDGMPTPWHTVHLGSRAAGGAGLVLTEATAVTPDGRITPGDLGLWSDDHIAPHRALSSIVREYGAVPGIQLAHAGRKAGRSRPWEGNSPLPRGEWGSILAPSPIPFRPGWHPPDEMSRDDMDEVVAAFASATGRAAAAGYQVLEAHFAHGYLMHQFLSPLANHRDDEYGGSLQNRVRFPLAVARAMRDAWPEQYPLFVRLSAVDWIEGGIPLDETVQVAAWMRDIGVDLIDVTSSGVVPGEKVPEAPLYHLDLSTRIRAEASIATGIVGHVRTAHDAARALQAGGGDIVLIGRAILNDAYWPRRAARELDATNAVEVPVQYRRATQHLE